jgi:non-ribosomal peptide synthetase component F
MNILSRFYKYNTRTAICDKYGTYTFGQVNKLAMQVAGKLRPHLENSDVSKRKTFSKQPCVAYFCPRDHTYVASQWASWHAGAIGVPLAENYPADDLRYILEDSGAAVVLSHASCVSALRPAAEKIGTPIVLVDEIGTSVEKDDVVPPLLQILVKTQCSSTPAAPPAARRACLFAIRYGRVFYNVANNLSHRIRSDQQLLCRHFLRRSALWLRHGTGPPTTASSVYCRSTMFTASSPFRCAARTEAG